MTDAINATSNIQGAVTAATSRYTLGPEADLHLPFGFGVEFDILYRHFNYAAGQSSAGVSAWDFPLLLTKRFLPGPIHPFVDVGVTYNKLSGLSDTNRTLAGSSGSTQNDSLRGLTFGGGVDVNLLKLHVKPELRAYTRMEFRGSEFYPSRRNVEWRPESSRVSRGHYVLKGHSRDAIHSLSYPAAACGMRPKRRSRE